MCHVIGHSLFCLIDAVIKYSVYGNRLLGVDDWVFTCLSLFVKRPYGCRNWKHTSSVLYSVDAVFKFIMALFEFIMPNCILITCETLYYVTHHNNKSNSCYKRRKRKNGSTYVGESDASTIACSKLTYLVVDYFHQFRRKLSGLFSLLSCSLHFNSMNNTKGITSWRVTQLNIETLL